jgi:hypothetical protein
VSRGRLAARYKKSVTPSIGSSAVAGRYLFQLLPGKQKDRDAKRGLLYCVHICAPLSGELLVVRCGLGAFPANPEPNPIEGFNVCDDGMSPSTECNTGFRLGPAVVTRHDAKVCDSRAYCRWFGSYINGYKFGFLDVKPT